MNSTVEETERRHMALGLFFVVLTVGFTVVGQLVLKWQVRDLDLPDGIVDKVVFILTQYLNPWVLFALFSGFIASATWMAAMTQIELSFAYPFMSMAFVIVIILSIIFFGEVFTWNKLIGTGFIVFGLIILVQ